MIRVAERGVGDASLALLQIQDALFDGIFCHQSVHEHRALLAQAVRAIGGLIFVPLACLIFNFVAKLVGGLEFVVTEGGNA